MAYNPYVQFVTTATSDGYFWQMDASGDMSSYRFTAQNTKTCDAIQFLAYKLGTMPTYKVGIQGDSSGEPDGTYISSNNTTFANGDVASAESYDWHRVALSSSVSLTSGTVYHIVFEYDSGTIDSSNYMRLVSHRDVPQIVAKDNTSDTSRSLLISSDSGSNWTTYNDDHAKFLIEYTDGTSEGSPYDALVGGYQIAENIHRLIHYHLWESG